MAAPSKVPHVPPALGVLDIQPRVRDFIAAAWMEGRLSHAYLFCGAPGSGMLEAALALAQLVVCPNGGDATCDECIRVRHRTHPDVHLLAPASVTGYLVSQVRELIADVPLAPVRARAKVYVLEDAGLLRGAAANALLKTIEEPVEGVIFVLLARSAEQVLPTIASRCQQVPFRPVPPRLAEGAVAEASGLAGPEVAIALSVAGTPERAEEFLSSPGRRKVRRLVVGTLGELARDDSWDVLCSARDFVAAVRSPLDDYRRQQSEGAKESADFLSAKALKQIEDANKRELTARERSGMMEALAAADSLLRDVLMRCEDVAKEPVNADVADVVDRIAALTDTRGALAAIGAVRRAADDLSHNVSPQLAFEAMLLCVKEALTCPPSSR